MTYDLNSFANIKDDPIDADSMTGYVNSIIPHDTYEDYATDILEEYATNIKLKQGLPIRADYWLGLKDGNKYLTVSKTDYDHDSIAEKSTILFYEASLISHMQPSLCVISYYAEVYGKSGKSHKCIIILFYGPNGMLVNVYTWDDDNNPEFLFVDTDNIAYQSADDKFVIYVTNVIISSLTVKIFPSLESNIQFLEQQGYSINKLYGLDTYSLDSRYLNMANYINRLK